MEQVIIVNQEDQPLTFMEKMEAHKLGALHRAFSIFIFNRVGEMLIHQRSFAKYHSGGLWSNACCSHPRPHESTQSAAERRLQEEMGFTTSIHKIFDFIYKADLDNGLIEHEFDHVFVGEYEGVIHKNEDEVVQFEFRKMLELEHQLNHQPELFTIWFQIAFPKVLAWWKTQINYTSSINSQFKDV